MTDTTWTDVSATISDDMVRWPTDAPVRIYKTEQIGVDDAVANVTAISSTAHLGTHVDAPLHFYAVGKDIASLPLDLMIGGAKVFRIRNETAVTYDEIKDFPIEQYDRVLFRTRNSDQDWERLPFIENYVYLATDAAEYLISKNVRCIGVDYLSIGGSHNNEQVHKLLLGKSVLIIEGLKLGHIENGSYDMVCLPLKIKDSDGAPARVILRKRA